MVILLEIIKQNKWRKIGGDIFLNIIATAIPIAALQLLILPSIAQQAGNEQYGQIVTLISLFTIIAEPIGGALNNSRLLMETTYQERGLIGDFNLLLTWSLPFVVVITVIGSLYYHETSAISISLLVLVAVLTVLRSYWSVAFRLKLDYKAILSNNALLCLGYLVGWGLFLYFKVWSLVYLMGTLFSIIYIMKSSALFKEPYQRTPLFPQSGKNFGILLGVNLLGNVTKYADRLLLYPLLGGATVSIYYSATVISKLISLAVGPINTVILSYFAKMKSLTKRTFCVMLFVGSIVGIIGYILCILIAEPVLHWLYPAWAAESMGLVFLTTASAVVGAVSNLVRPAVLKFRNINWQMLLGGIDTMLYIGLAAVFYLIAGLKGFCIGLLINSIVQLFLRIVVFLTQPQNEF